MAGHRFELVGGNIALDFVNTIHDWTVPVPRDYLTDFSEAVRFSAAAGVISARDARHLGALPSRRELPKLRELRGRLERILRAVVAKRVLLPADLDALTHDAADAARSARLRQSSSVLTREIDVKTAGAHAVRLRLVDAALALLTSDRMANLKTCPSCGWFFLDTSKNRSRRWCSMAACGSSAKARRYYWRTKSRRSSSPAGRP